VTRRDAAWAIARAAAVAAAPEFLNAWLPQTPSAAPPEPDRWSNYQPRFFSADEIKALDVFTSILIPTDETPGAREAHVVPFVDFVVNAASEYEPSLQQDWRAALRVLHERRFLELTAGEQLALVEKMSHPEDHDHDAFQLVKDMTVHAFYTSRAGLIDVLEYQGNAYLTQFPGCAHPEHHRV